MRMFNDVSHNRISTFVVTASWNQNNRLTVTTCGFYCHSYVHVSSSFPLAALLSQHYLDNLNLSKRLESQTDQVEIQKHQLETQNEQIIELQTGMGKFITNIHLFCIMYITFHHFTFPIVSLLYSRYYAKACNKCRVHLRG